MFPALTHPGMLGVGVVPKNTSSRRGSDRRGSGLGAVSGEAPPKRLLQREWSEGLGGKATMRTGLNRA